MKKGIMLALCVMLFSIVISACGSNNNESQPASSKEAKSTSSAAPAKDVKLTFAIWGNDTHKKMYEDMIAEYKAIKPNVSVEIMTIPAGEFQQKISVMLASKTAPDVMWMLERAIPQFLDNGQIEDISSIKSDSAYEFADFIPSTLELVSRGDQLFGIPFSTPPNMMYYNKNLFAAKGLKTPTELYKEGKWTYEEMEKAAAAISQPEQGIYGFNMILPSTSWTGSWMESMISLVWAYGADYFSPDNKTFTLNTPEGEKALQFFSDAMFKSQIHPKPGDQTGFESGKIGMQQNLLSYIGKAKEIKDFEWDIAPMPEGPGGQGTTLGYAAYMVTKDSSNKAESIEFLKFLTNKENMAVSSQFFVPGRKSVLGADAFLNQGPSPESVRTAILDQMDKARVRPGFNNYQRIDDKMKQNFDSIYTQAGTIPDIIKKMEADVSPILKE
jgi:multiple sugar transport system substrate-binding protein